jgi:hypothetical protein
LKVEQPFVNCSRLYVGAQSDLRSSKQVWGGGEGAEQASSPFSVETCGATQGCRSENQLRITPRHRNFCDVGRYLPQIEPGRQLDCEPRPAQVPLQQWEDPSESRWKQSRLSGRQLESER